MLHVGLKLRTIRTMLSLQTESFVAARKELKRVIPLHYEELALNKDKVPLQPRWSVYDTAEKAGELLFVTCRNDGELIGYFIGFIAPGLHYETCLTCSMDIFYVCKEHRNGSLGLRLFKYVERELKARQVQRVFVGSKVHADASKLFERLDYSRVEIYYSKWLGE